VRIGKFCCTSLRSLPPKGGLVINAVFLLNVGEVFGEGVGMDDVGRVNAMQNHVHDGDDVGEGLLLLADEGALLEGFHVLRGQVVVLSEVLKGLAEESRRADRAVVNALADAGLHDLNDGADEREECNILRRCARGCPCS
jgi:hypothetical protein